MTHVRVSEENTVEYRVRLGVIGQSIEQCELKGDVGGCVDDPTLARQRIDDPEARGGQTWPVDTARSATTRLRPSPVLSDSEDRHVGSGAAHAFERNQAAFSRETETWIGEDNSM